MEDARLAKKFPTSHAFDIMLRLLNGDSCALALSQCYVHPCVETNNNMCAAILDAASRGEEIGRGVHGVVRMVPDLPQLNARLGRSKRVVAKICLRPIDNAQTMLRDMNADTQLHQFVAEMLHAALLSALVDRQLTIHLVRAGPFVTSDDAACYAMEHMNGDLSNIKPGRLSAHDADAVLLAVLHTLMLLQETYGMTHNDLKPGNVFVAPRGGADGEDEDEWWGYEIGTRVAYVRAPAFTIKIGDPGVAVSHHIRMGELERVLATPLGPKELVRNRMPIRGAPVPGQWVRVVENGRATTDGVVLHASPHDTLTRIQSDSIFSVMADDSDKDTGVGTPDSAASSASTCITVDRRKTKLLALNAAFEAFGVHGSPQAGYDLHFFIIHFTRVLAEHSIDHADMPLFRAVRSLHSFSSCQDDERMPWRIRHMMRPRHNDVFPLSAKEVLDHPAITNVLKWDAPPDSTVKIMGRAHA